MTKQNYEMFNEHVISIPIKLVQELDPYQLAVYCRLLSQCSAHAQVKLNIIDMSEELGISQVNLKHIFSQLSRINYFVKGSLISIIDAGHSSQKIVQIHRVEVS